MYFKLLFFTVVYLLGCNAKEIPSFLKVCHKNEVNMQECFVAAGEELRPYLITGVPEYNIPSLEPLVLNELISEESGGIRITAKNVKTWGCSDYFIRSLSIDLDKQYYEIDVEFPQMRIESEYTVEGKLLLMPIKGQGPMQANVSDIKSKTILQGEIFDKNGEKYLKYTKMDVKTHVGGGHVKVENLFNGDKLLSDVINDTINKNLDAFLKELMPVIDRALSVKFMEIANGIVENFTYDQLFPE